MKLLILLLLISVNASASSFYWFNPGSPETAYTKRCEGCYKVNLGENTSDYDILDVPEPDYDKDPTLQVSKEESCVDESDCLSKNVQGDFCVESDSFYYGDRDEDGTLEAWCIATVYPTKLVKKAVVNEARKAARLQAKAQKDAKEGAIRQALNAIQCGKRVIAFMAVLNMSKDPLPTKQEIRALTKALTDIKGELETGSLVTAAESIQNLDVSGLIVTEDDKTKILNELNSCQGS